MLDTYSQATGGAPFSHNIARYSLAILFCLGGLSFVVYLASNFIGFSKYTHIILTLICLGFILSIFSVAKHYLHYRDDKIYKSLPLVLSQPSILTDQHIKELGEFNNAEDRLFSLIQSVSADPQKDLRNMVTEARYLGSTRRSFDTIVFKVSHLGRHRYLWQFENTEKNVTSAVAKEPVSEGLGLSADIPQLDFEAFLLPLALFDQYGRLREANAAARNLLGDVSQNASCFHELFDGLGQPVSIWLEGVISERVKSSSEVLHYIPSSGEKFIHVYLSKYTLSKEPMALAILTDGGSLKKIGLQFSQSQKMQAIGQLAGGISHDFNNLLTAISGYCDLLLLSRTENDPDYHDLNQIRQNTNRAASLVAQLLAFSRKQPLVSEVLDCNEVLNEISHLLNRLLGEKFKLLLKNDKNSAYIFADKRRIEQVIVNLALNARDAMRKGGIITIDLDRFDLQEGMRRENFDIPKGLYVRMKIKDSGEGIRPDVISKIFDPFYTTKPIGQGTGLGLSTAYGIIKQSGGYIFADSEIGLGTTFTLLLPAYQGKKAAIAPPNEKCLEAPANRSLGILIIDDELSIRELLTRSFNRLGYRAYPFDNVESAVRFLARNPHRVGTIITDIVMPDASGIDFARHTRDLAPDVRIIFISGYADESIIEETRRMTNTRLVNKPFKISELTSLLPEHVMSATASSEH